MINHKKKKLRKLQMNEHEMILQQALVSLDPPFLNEQGGLAIMYVRFFKKNAEIFKMKLYNYSPVFPIDYNGSVKY